METMTSHAEHNHSGIISRGHKMPSVGHEEVTGLPAGVTMEEAETLKPMLFPEAKLKNELSSSNPSSEKVQAMLDKALNRLEGGDFT